MTSIATLLPETLLACPVEPVVDAAVPVPVAEPAVKRAEPAVKRAEPAVEAKPAVEPEPDVLGLDAAGTLAWVVERRRRQDQAAAEELRAVTHWADLHQVTDGPVGAADPEIRDVVNRRIFRREVTGTGARGLLGVEEELRLAGQGAFRVEEFAVAELAAALGMSEPAGRAYVGQAVELRDRLPRCWDQAMALELPAWKARQIAEKTIPLTAEAAAWVDTCLAGHAGRLSLYRILAAVDAAIPRFDPTEAQRRAEAAAEKRGVWTEERLDGTTTLTAVTDTPDAVAFDSALTSIASSLAALGDPDPLHLRRAKAVGILADPQYALTLTTPAAVEAGAVQVREHQAPGGRGGTTGLGGPTIHVHVHTDEPVGRVTGTTVSGHHPVPRVAVERWLTGLRPGATVKVTPVVDLTEHHAVDAYEVPTRIRDHVALRDLGTCRFPWCNRTRGLDTDHVEPYRFNNPDDPGGGRPPPGQTSTSNLALLCRFHHRLKTHTGAHGGWSYTLTHDTVCTWTSPLGRRYSVDEHGTRPLP